MKKNQIANNMLWNGVSVTINCLIALTLTPYITNNIGIEATGFVSLANTCVGYIDIICIALNAFGTRNIAMAHHKGDMETESQYYSSILIANIVLTGIINIICLIIILNLQNFLNISEGIETDVKILFFLVLFNYTINIFVNIFSIGAFVRNKISVTYRIKGFSSVLYALALAFLIFLFDIKVYFIAIGNLLSVIFCLVFNYYVKKQMIPELKFDIRKFSINKIRKLIGSGIWNSINNIGTLLNTGLDLIVTNKMLSQIMMGQISVAKQISSIMTTFTVVVVNAFQPKQLELYAKGDITGLTETLNMSMRFGALLSNIMFTCFFTLGLDFLSLWIPGQDVLYIYLLSIIVVFGDIIVTVARPLYYVFTLTDRLKTVSFITISIGLTNFISMIVLIKLTDLEGYIIVGTTCVLNFLANFIITPYLAVKFLLLKHNPFTSTLIRHVISCFFITFIIAFISYKYPVNDWFHFIIKGGIVFCLTTAMAIIFQLKKNERNSIIEKLKNKMKGV